MICWMQAELVQYGTNPVETCMGVVQSGLGYQDMSEPAPIRISDLTGYGSYV